MDFRDYPYNALMFKEAHNAEELSHDREVPEDLIERLLYWNRDAPGKNGCRGLEFDLSQEKGVWEWTVDHGNGKRGLRLSAYLDAIAAWSDENPDHDVITIHFDLKSDHAFLSDDEFATEFDAYLRGSFGDTDRLYKPAALMGKGWDLVSGAMSNGWPALSVLRNRFIFVLTGSDNDNNVVAKRKAVYSTGDPRNRLCFVDRSLHGDDDYRPSNTGGDRVFFNYHVYAKHRKKWSRTFDWYHQQAGFVTRAWILNNPRIWNFAMAGGPNILTTDIMDKHMIGQRFAFVGDAPFRPIR